MSRYLNFSRSRLAILKASWMTALTVLPSSRAISFSSFYRSEGSEILFFDSGSHKLTSGIPKSYYLSRRQANHSDADLAKCQQDYLSPRPFSLWSEKRESGIRGACGWISEATCVRLGERCENVSFGGSYRDDVLYRPSTKDHRIRN